MSLTLTKAIKFLVRNRTTIIYNNTDDDSWSLKRLVKGFLREIDLPNDVAGELLSNGHIILYQSKKNQTLYIRNES